MYSGQIQLIIGALVLLATVQVWMDNSFLRLYVQEYHSEATIQASAIAESMIDEAMKKSFDEKAIAAKCFATSALTPVAQLGPESPVTFRGGADAEPFASIRLFNDIDDYNRYSRVVSSATLGDFFVTDSVCYIATDQQDVASASPTWGKLLVVTVTHPNLLHPIVLRAVKMYHRYE